MRKEEEKGLYPVTEPEVVNLHVIENNNKTEAKVLYRDADNHNEKPEVGMLHCHPDKENNKTEAEMVHQNVNRYNNASAEEMLNSDADNHDNKLKAEVLPRHGQNDHSERPKIRDLYTDECKRKEPNNIEPEVINQHNDECKVERKQSNNIEPEIINQHTDDDMGKRPEVAEQPESTNEKDMEDEENGLNNRKTATRPEVLDQPEVEVNNVELKNNDMVLKGDNKNCEEDDEGLSSIREKKQKPTMSKGLKVFLTICNCFLATLAIGYLLAMGVMFVAIIDDLKTTRAEASPIVSVFTGFVFAGGGVVGPLMNKYNGGYICMVGGVLGCIGCIISSFAPSIPYLIVGTGVLTGFGLAIAFILPFTTTREIFNKHQATMLTVVGMSPGIGTVIFPYMTSRLVQEFGWRGVFLIYAGIVLQCVPIGYLNAVVKRRYVATSVEETRWRDVFNCSLFKKPRYLVLVLCVFLMNTLFPTINFFFVDMARGKGFDVQTSSTILSINGFCNVAARVAMIFVKPFIKFPLMSQWSVYVLIMSACVSLYVFADTYPYLLTVAILFGVVWGLTVVTYPAMLLEISGPKRFAAAMGYCNLVGGLGGLVGAPASGAVKDATGSYDLVYFSTTTLGLISSCLLGIISVQTYLKQRRARRNDNSAKSNNVPIGEINPAFSEDKVGVV